MLVVEAEDFAGQYLDDIRRWYRVAADSLPEVTPDADPPHLEGASGGAYLEALPDTRQTHGDTITPGINFAPAPGKMAILTYPVVIEEPGRYYVWARIYSTGSEDNGLHVGINGTWPESGQRLQWIAKRQWKWRSAQRTPEKHVGVPGQIWLDIEEPGVHLIHFSMREDGTEFDKWLMTLTKDMPEPEGTGPAASPREHLSSDGLEKLEALKAKLADHIEMTAREAAAKAE
ncbi:MAG: hypothetical protein AAF561_15455 [Planctomycetota bacterium]